MRLSIMCGTCATTCSTCAGGRNFVSRDSSSAQMNVGAHLAGQIPECAVEQPIHVGQRVRPLVPRRLYGPVFHVNLAGSSAICQSWERESHARAIWPLVGE